MIVTGHWAIQNVITGGLSAFAANAATLTPQIFADAPSSVQTEIQTLYGNSATHVQVTLGYPMTATPELPGVWIYGQAGQELVDHDILGNTVQTTLTSSTSTTVSGIAFRSTWAILCATANANASLALNALVEWALDSQRQALMETLGAWTMTLSWGAWAPMPNSAGDVIFPYARTLMLTAEAYNTWTSTDTDLVTSVTPYFVRAD